MSFNNFISGYQGGQQLKEGRAQSQAYQANQYEMADKARQATKFNQIAYDKASSGDLRGGTIAAGAGGNTDLMTAIQSMSEADREEAKAKTQKIGKLAAFGTTLDESRLVPFMQEAARELGIDPAQVPTNPVQAREALGSLASEVRDVETMIEQARGSTQVMGDQLVNVQTADNGDVTATEAFKRDQTYGEAETNRSNLVSEGISQQTADTNRMNARTAATKAQQPEKAKFGDVMRLKGDFDKQAREFETAFNSYSTMQNLADDATGASDVALGFAFFKAIDPASTVREGEFAMAGKSMGLPDQLVAKLNQVDNGQMFTPQLRQELIQAAGHAVRQQKSIIDELKTRTGSFASEYGIDPNQVTYDPTGGRGVPETMASSAPTPSQDAVRVNSPEEMARLPSGAKFIAPDGSVRVKP